MRGYRSKYGARKTTFQGETFDSAKERDHYILLLAKEREGRISNLRRQVGYELLPAIHEEKVVELKTKTKVVDRVAQKAVRYIADFVYTDNETGREVVVDVKGVRTKEYILKKKMMKALLGIDITEV